MTPQQKANYLNLLNFAIRVFRMDVKDKPKLHKLKQEISIANNVADKSWLMEKMNEICPD